MSTIRMIATDLDGTLLNSQGKVSQENLNALQGALQRGIIVAISTGRMFSSSVHIAEQIGITAPMICYNGAMIVDPKSRSVLHHTPLDLGLAHEVLAHLKGQDLCVQTYIDDTLYIRNEDIALTREYESVYGIVGVPAGEALYSPTQAPTKVLIIEENASQAQALEFALQKQFGDRTYIARSSSQFVEIMNPNTNKGVAVQELARRYGLEMDSVLALGDGGNDVEMLSAAGVSIAIGNGTAAAKAAAKVIGPGNDQHAVAWAIGEYILK